MKNSKTFVRLSAVIMAAVLSVSSAFAASAAEKSEKINEVTINVVCDLLSVGDDDSSVDITADQDAPYCVDSFSPLNLSSSGWLEGTKPRFRIVLSAEEGYKFAEPCSKPSGINVCGEGEAYYSERSEFPDYQTLEVYIELEEVSRSDDDWSVNPNQNMGTTDGAWLRDNKGWWYCNADRTYTRNNWQLINGKWYFFNIDGYMLASQWIQWKNIWYYLGPDGDMWAGRRTPDGYYVDNTGAWVPGK